MRGRWRTRIRSKALGLEVANRQDRVYWLAEFRYQDRLLKRRACSERFWSACWPIAGDKEKRQAPPVDDLGDRADAITGNVYVENGEVKNSRLCQSLPDLDVARLRNHAMPKLFDHVR